MLTKISQQNFNFYLESYQRTPSNLKIDLKDSGTGS